MKAVVGVLLLALLAPAGATAAPGLLGLPTLHYVSNTNVNGIPVGSDSNYGGINTPWLTLDYALATVNAGDVIMCNDGIYTPATSYAVTKNLTIKSVTALGCHPEGVAANASLFSVTTGKTLTLNGIMADGQSNNTQVVLLNNNSALVDTNSTITGATLYGVSGQSDTITATGTTCSLGSARACYYLSTTTNNGVITLHGGSATVTAQVAGPYGGAVTLFNTNGAPSLTVDGSFAYAITAAGASVHDVFLTQSALVNISGASGSITAAAGIGSCNILAHSYASVTAGSVTGGAISTSSGTNACADGGHMELIGYDNDTPGQFASPPVINNFNSTNNSWTGTAAWKASGGHGVLYGGGSGGGQSIGDTVDTAAIAYIAKGTVSGPIFSAGYSTNISAEVWYAKSCQGCQWWNMTDDEPDGSLPVGFLALSPDVGAPLPANVQFHNLVVNYQNAGLGGQYVQIGDITWFDSLGNNDYFAVGGNHATCGWQIGATCYTTLAAYAAASGETNSLNVSPLFVSSSNHALQAGSTLKTAGTTTPGTVTVDFTGYAFANPPSIGAYQYH